MIRSDIAQYGAITTIEVERRTGPAITGYAAPRSGARPSALALKAGDTTVAVVRASRYSPAAAEAGVRAGWCGFQLEALPQAFALSSDVTLSCVATGRVLEKLAFSPDVYSEAPQPAQPLTAAEVWVAGSASERCEDVGQILPFAIDHRNRHGVRAVLEATYIMLLERAPDGGAYEGHSPKIATDAGLLEMMQDVEASHEFRSKTLRLIPGPFHPAFRYDRGLLG